MTRRGWLLLAVLLAGCVSGTPGYYEVRRGDTLYSIAQRHGLDYRELAAANGLGYPYLLKPGQRLRLPQPRPGHHVVRKGETLYSIAWRYGLDYRSLAAANRIRYPYVIYPGQRLRLTTTSARKTEASKKTDSRPRVPKPTVTSKKPEPSSRPASPPPPADGGDWQWPARGDVLHTFSTSGGKVNKGIDIGGQRGQPVHSARAGTVVYAGTGLTGYGRLVIVKHDAVFLSAYAHNHRILVKEGQRVKGGQKIAEMGDSSASRVMLHFEIRREGKPVDPLRYLPHR